MPVQIASIKDQIKSFIELQKIDSEIYKIRKDLNLIPQKVAGVEGELEGKKTHLKQLDQDYKTQQTRRKELELELQEMEDRVNKGNAQLLQLKTNKEYSAMITEIEGIKADKSILEDKILEVMTQTEATLQQLNEEKARLAGDEQKFQEQKKAIEEESAGIQKKVDELKQGRVKLISEVDPNLCGHYEKILERKQGSAIVPVLKGNKCGGCYMNLTQQKVNEIRAYKALVQCENCVRIIYLEEDLI